MGVIIQFGGQTPLKLAVPLQAYLESAANDTAGNPIKTQIWGTSPDAIDAAEDRERFEQILRELDIRQPPNGLARSYNESLEIAQ